MMQQRYYDRTLTPSLEQELEQLRLAMIPPPQKPKHGIPWWIEAGFYVTLALGALAFMAICGWLWNAIAELVK